jgi:hypothetical protein
MPRGWHPTSQSSPPQQTHRENPQTQIGHQQAELEGQGAAEEEDNGVGDNVEGDNNYEEAGDDQEVDQEEGQGEEYKQVYVSR